MFSYLSILPVGSLRLEQKDIPNCELTSPTRPEVDFLNELHSYQNRKTMEKANPYQNFFFFFFKKKDSFRKIHLGQLLHLSDSTVFADFANPCSLSMMLFTYPFIYSWKKQLLRTHCMCLARCSWYGCAQRTAAWHSDRMDAWPNRVRTQGTTWSLPQWY